MSDKIITRQMMPPGTPDLQQNGGKNVNVNNQAGGIVHLNVTLPPLSTSGSADKMMGILNFSKEYYQFLVTYEKDVFVNNIIIISTD